MKLSAYAKKHGITYRTALNWFHTNQIKGSYQLENGTIIVEDIPTEQSINNIVIYSRVSNHSRKEELNYQVDRCISYCTAKGYSISKIHKEVASDMNDNRKEFWRMIESKPDIIVVEHKDRLTRFGFKYLERLLPQLGCKIEVINRDHEDEKDLIKDLVSIITSFCCRLYGLRRGTAKSKEIQKVIND